MKQHQKRVAERAKGNNPDLVPGVTSKSSFLNMLDTLLETDRATLKGYESVALKEQEKRERLIPAYRPHIQRLKDEGAKHDLLGFFLLWLFDAGFINEAMEHATYCMTHGVTMPEGIKTKTQTMVCDLLGKWAWNEVKNGHSPEPYLSDLIRFIEESTPAGSVPDIQNKSLGRLYKTHGFVAEKEGRWQDAVSAFTHAKRLGENVQTKLETCTKKLAAQPADDTSNEPAATEQQDA